MKVQILKEINGKWLPVIEEVPDEQMPQVEDTRSYEEKVVDGIREKYSLDQELAILRQRDTKPQEFQEYFNYVEEVKQNAKK